MRSVLVGAATAAVLTGCALAPQPRAASAWPMTTGQAAQDADERRSAAFDEYMQAAVQNAQFSGTVLVAKDGVPIFRRSYGLASQELNVPNTDDTVYQIQSITKPFTAILIMMLQEDGALDVNDRACGYLADCPAAWRAITIHQLLTHTSGIEGYSRLPDWDETLDSRTY